MDYLFLQDEEIIDFEDNLLDVDADFLEGDESILQDDEIIDFEDNQLDVDADFLEGDESILQDNENCDEEKKENNILQEGSEDRSKVSSVNVDFQESEKTILQNVEILNGKDCVEKREEIGSLESNKVQEGGEDRSKVSGLNADFQEGEKPILQNAEILNREDCVEKKEEGKQCAEEEDQQASLELKNISEKDSENRSNVKGAITRDNVIFDEALNPEMVNDDDGIKYEKDDEEASCSGNNMPERKPDTRNITDDSQSNNLDLDYPIKLQSVNNDVIAKRRSIITLPRQIRNEDFDDEEEDGARCLENNILEPNVMDDDECTKILTVRNKILEIFPDVEETYLLLLCFDCNKLGGDTMEEVSEILLRGDYPINPKLQDYYVAKMKEILPLDDDYDEILNYLASNIKTEDEFKKFVNDTYETGIMEPNPFEVTEVDAELLFNCPCCCEEDLKIEAMVDCSNGCYTCKNCVVRNMEITYGEGFVRMTCLMNCGGKYTINQLQDFMNPTLFAGIGQLLQKREIEEANINDLHRCPFCDYAAIVEEVIFNCTQCGKDSCILCQKEPHPSLLCSQVEDDDDVRKRTFVENQMSEALFRTCPKCKVKIIKDEGCNKMTCPCGTMMCYVCKAVVSDYTHFNGQGGSNYHLCPLYNDTEEMHAANVRNRAEQAMNEIGGNLKIDPTV